MNTNDRRWWGLTKLPFCCCWIQAPAFSPLSCHCRSTRPTSTSPRTFVSDGRVVNLSQLQRRRSTSCSCRHSTVLPVTRPSASVLRALIDSLHSNSADFTIWHSLLTWIHILGVEHIARVSGSTGQATASQCKASIENHISIIEMPFVRRRRAIRVAGERNNHAGDGARRDHPVPSCCSQRKTAQVCTRASINQDAVLSYSRHSWQPQQPHRSRRLSLFVTRVSSTHSQDSNDVLLLSYAAILTQSYSALNQAWHECSAAAQI